MFPLYSEYLKRELHYEEPQVHRFAWLWSSQLYSLTLSLPSATLASTLVSLAVRAIFGALLITLVQGFSTTVLGLDIHPSLQQRYSSLATQASSPHYVSIFRQASSL